MSAASPADVVLIVAPVGADARNIHAVLARSGLTPRICRNEDEFAATSSESCGALVITEEAITESFRDALLRSFAAQPPWSDIPIVLIGSGAPSHLASRLAHHLKGPRRSITVLERPLQAASLLATLDTLLAARHRQYEIRDLLAERDQLLNSLEKRVAERTEELQRMVEEMEGFSYSVSHDLRSPLRSLAGYADALLEDYGEQLPDGARVYCDRIIRAARRMDNLTQDVLAYTRVTRGEMELGAVDLDLVLAEVIDQYPALAAVAEGIQVHRPLGCVRGHMPSLLQCFSNLLGNAVKFVPTDREPRIDVRSVRIGDRYRISVIDNGPGLHPSDHARVFRMFERAADKKVAGTGIGLTIVKRAVERMGGTVGVISEPGCGAEFWLDFEAANPPDTADSPARNFAALWPQSQLHATGGVLAGQ